ncbi:T-box transcription factor TBX2-like [Sorex araneus]|uniref:T-box transcription factor TBX2-like n=1 Tax=Sorex araneus TaxID=42254 RepID=UPI0024335DE9|nr:T-box transcription factor TBX2-like [Sorex araneus]
MRRKTEPEARPAPAPPGRQPPARPRPALATAHSGRAGMAPRAPDSAAPPLGRGPAGGNLRHLRPRPRPFRDGTRHSSANPAKGGGEGGAGARFSVNDLPTRLTLLKRKKPEVRPPGYSCNSPSFLIAGKRTTVKDKVSYTAAWTRDALYFGYEHLQFNKRNK